MNPSIKITLYESWMKPQIAKLFEHEYGIRAEDFESFMTRLYDHPFQSDQCIRIVALDSEKVVGFQSFFFWPYIRQGKSYRSFQSGNSLIDPSYRGKGLFNRMLQFAFERNDLITADFFIGFPVQASYNSFIKNNWQNVLNLQWHVKFMNPFAFLFKSRLPDKYFTKTFEPSSYSSEAFRLSEDPVFFKWKQELKTETFHYYYYTYTKEPGIKITFELKFQKRKKIIHEVIIGKIYFSENAGPHLKDAIQGLVKQLRRSLCVSMCSVALNEHIKTPDYKTAFTGCGFKRIDKHVYFIVKPLAIADHISDASEWDIGRADIDTW